MKPHLTNQSIYCVVLSFIEGRFALKLLAVARVGGGAQRKGLAKVYLARALRLERENVLVYKALGRESNIINILELLYANLMLRLFLRPTSRGAVPAWRVWRGLYPLAEALVFSANLRGAEVKLLLRPALFNLRCISQGSATLLDLIKAGRKDFWVKRQALGSSVVAGEVVVELDWHGVGHRVE